MVYYIVLTAIIIFASFLDLTNCKRNSFAYLSIFVALFLIAGLRAFSVGNDTLVYKGWYDSIEIISPYIRTEPGFATWMLFVHHITNGNFILFLLLTAFFSISIKFCFFRKKLPLVFIPILVYYADYYYIAEFNQIRQGLAFGICLYAFSSFIDKKKKQFFALTIIASLLHFSSLLVLLTPVFVKVRTLSKVSMLTILSALFIFPLINMNALVINVVDTVVSYIPIEMLQLKMNGYLTRDIYNVSSGIGFRAVLYFVEMIIFLYYRDQMKSEQYNKWMTLFFVGVCMYYPLLCFGGIVRLSTTFCFLSAVLYSFIISYEKNKLTKIALYTFIVLTSLIKIAGFVRSGVMQQYLPYHFSI